MSIPAEIRPSAPPERGAGATYDPHPAGDDTSLPGIDRAILRVADHLRRAGADAPEADLRRIAEEIVLDAARVVLDWVEVPRAAVG